MTKIFASALLAMIVTTATAPTASAMSWVQFGKKINAVDHMSPAAKAKAIHGQNPPRHERPHRPWHD
jgi:hypothetical protein